MATRAALYFPVDTKHAEANGKDTWNILIAGKRVTIIAAATLRNTLATRCHLDAILSTAIENATFSSDIRGLATDCVSLATTTNTRG